MRDDPSIESLAMVAVLEESPCPHNPEFAPAILCGRCIAVAMDGADAVHWSEWSARQRIGVLSAIAEYLVAEEAPSVGEIARRLGLSREEAHGAGEVVASLVFFAREKGFLGWQSRIGADHCLCHEVRALPGDRCPQCGLIRRGGRKKRGGRES